ncbi:MAG: glycoside hydrolase family 2 TIM barrel-domain containing protein, partial [Candidatus Electryoneaceae bacterium]|nr:glycoside hydrolase family 2 TIM barrel-domain containing protein [Candidatus Electryoneaceae bacterium]
MINHPNPLHFTCFAALLSICLLVGLHAHTIDAEELRLIEPIETPSLLEGRGKWSQGDGDTIITLTGAWKATHHKIPIDSITIPSYWDSRTEQLLLTRRFKLPQEMQDRIWRLVIDGFAYTLAITLNGELLGSRSGEGASLQMDITPGSLRFGSTDNELTLSISNRSAHHGNLLLSDGIYFRKRYDGISRNIYLIASPPVAVTQLAAHWTITDSMSEVVSVRAVLQRQSNFIDSNSYRHITTLFGPDGTVLTTNKSQPFTFPPSGSVKIAVNLPTAPLDRWTVRTPGSSPLHRVRCELFVHDHPNAIHTSTVTFGAKSLMITPSGFMIDGQFRWLRCVNYYETYPEDSELTQSEWIERDLTLIKELGADAVRIAQGQAPPYLLDLCDRYGLLVFEELPVFQTPDPILSDPGFIRSARNQLEAMILRDSQFTCIAGWGIGSEINPPNQVNAPYYDALTQYARDMDDRPIYASICIGAPGSFESDFSAAPLDFAILELTLYSRFNQFRTESSGDLPDRIHYDIPVLLGSVRQMVTSDKLGGWNDPTSQAGQAHHLISTIQKAERLNWCGGVVAGDLTDWYGKVPIITAQSMNHLYTTGLMNQHRQPRLAFRCLAGYWTSGVIHPLDSAVVSEKNRGLFLIVGFGLLLILFISTRQNHLFKSSLARTFSSPQGFFRDISDRRFVHSGSTLIISLLFSGALALVVVGWLTAYRQSYPLDWAFGYLFGDGKLHSFIAHLIWQPARELLFFWGLIFLLVLIRTVRASIISFILKKPLSLVQAFDFVVWSFVVCLGLIPVGM